ncbi:MAG: OstA family protein [Bryobacterales bacterium]|nr:OstA family protein [Bryobacterales bacterium]
MRGTRWLLLVAIVAILAGIGLTYRIQKRALAGTAPPKPVQLPASLSGTREDFKWTRREQGRAVVEIHARQLRQEKDSNQVHLEQVDLKIFNKPGDQYNLVKCAKAEFDQGSSHLYSEGDVEITLSVPVEGQPTRPLVNIKSSGVTFDVKTGKAATDRAAIFTFENGTGKSVGAWYDPTSRELHLVHDVEINRKAPGPHAAPMKIEAGELTYKEAASVVWLTHGARLTRENTVVNADSAVVQLEVDAIRQVDAVKAHGVDEYPKRKLEYEAGELRVTYSDEGQVDRVSGRTNARLVSTSEGSETAMTSDAVELDFVPSETQSILKKAVGNGNATIESKPVAPPGGKLAETRVVHSQIIEVQMRPGGREIETVETQAPGQLDFIPNQATQRQRRLNADHMIMKYGPANQLESFRALNVQTETQPAADERAKKPGVSKTHSKNMSAEFDPKTGQMQHMEQWDDFAYEQGDRKARADRAILDAEHNVMTLQRSARVTDATGVTSADHIRMDQKTGDFAAEGHVSSSRQPDKKGAPSGMLSGDQPLEALADRMNAANHNRSIKYEGHVVMWQGGDRITADRVEIDREKRSLQAAGGVVTQFMEKAKDDDGARSRAQSQIPNPTSQPPVQPAPIFVVVKAARLVYTEQDRLAQYSGGVLLNRPGLQVKADELRAFLAESKNDKSKAASVDQDTAGDESRIEKAYADGHVEIVQAATDRTRTGTGEHAEYYTTDERIIIRGGQPQMVDSKKGYTRGAELTYFVNDDRLLVSGGPKQRATSRLRRK